MNLSFLARLSSVSEAELVCGRLKEEGIETVLQKDAVLGAGSFIQGAEIFVQKADLERARLILGK